MILSVSLMKNGLFDFKLLKVLFGKAVALNPLLSTWSRLEHFNTLVHIMLFALADKSQEYASI